MLKKFVLFIILVLPISGCDYSPIHSIKTNDVEIKIISMSGDKEINNYLSKELEKKSKDSSEKIEVIINTNFSKRVLAKDTKSFATDYELQVIGNFELRKDDNSKSVKITEIISPLLKLLLLLFWSEIVVYSLNASFSES